MHKEVGLRVMSHFHSYIKLMNSVFVVVTMTIEGVKKPVRSDFVNEKDEIVQI